MESLTLVLLFFGPEINSEEVIAFRKKVLDEVNNILLFKGDPRFIQFVQALEYEKDGFYKIRLVTDYFEYDLHDLFNEGNLSSAEMKDVALQMVGIVNAVQEKGYYMRDIKPENFLAKNINGKWVVACCDLNSFCKMNDRSLLSNREGTSWYWSPEFMRKVASKGNVADVITDKHDVWALGISFAMMFDFFEIVTFCSEKSDRELIKVLANLEEGWIQEPRDGTFKHVVWQMLQVDPNKRPSIKEAYSLLNK